MLGVALPAPAAPASTNGASAPREAAGAGLPLVATVRLFGNASAYRSDALAAVRTGAELVLHPEEGRRHGLADGGRARLRSPHGECVVPGAPRRRPPGGGRVRRRRRPRVRGRPAPASRPRPRAGRGSRWRDGRDLPRHPHQGRGGGVRARHGVRVHAALGAQAARPLPGALRPEPHRARRLHAAARRRGEADLQGGLRPPGGQQDPLPARPDDLGRRGRRRPWR